MRPSASESSRSSSQRKMRSQGQDCGRRELQDCFPRKLLGVAHQIGLAPRAQEGIRRVGVPQHQRTSPRPTVAGSMDARHNLDGSLLEDRPEAQQGEAHHVAEPPLQMHVPSDPGLVA